MIATTEKLLGGTPDCASGLRLPRTFLGGVLNYALDSSRLLAPRNDITRGGYATEDYASEVSLRRFWRPLSAQIFSAWPLSCPFPDEV